TLELRHPDPSAAGAATERVTAASGHLHELRADRREHPARLVVDAVVTAERAGVVVCHPVAERPLRRESAVLEQLEQELRVVDDIPVDAERRILVSERVERVRVPGQDPVERAARERGDVHMALMSEQTPLAATPDVAAR